jgi:hypothetical protein
MSDDFQYDDFVEDKPISDDLLALYNKNLAPIRLWQFVEVVKIDHVLGLRFVKRGPTGAIEERFVAVTSDGEWNEAGHVVLIDPKDIQEKA